MQSREAVLQGHSQEHSREAHGAGTKLSLEAPRRLARWGRLGPWHGFSNQNPRNWDKFLVSVPERETLIYLFLFIPKALFPSTGDRLGIWTLGNSQMSDNGSRQP